MLTKAKGEVKGRIHQTGNGYYHVSRVDSGQGQRVEVVLGCQDVYGVVELSPVEVNEFIERLTKARDDVLIEHERVRAKQVSP